MINHGAENFSQKGYNYILKLKSFLLKKHFYIEIECYS